MSYFMCDVEADGPCPGLYSMIQIGCVVVEPGLSRTFRGFLKPISDGFQQEALDIYGLTREETLKYPEASDTI